MPDAKYYDRSGTGNGKYSLGWDNEDLDMTVKGGMETPTMSMPTEKTTDKPMNQDGGIGKPWAKTLASRRGNSSGGDGSTPGGYGGPNAQ